jgi:hypothetical protein
VRTSYRRGCGLFVARSVTACNRTDERHTELAADVLPRQHPHRLYVVPQRELYIMNATLRRAAANIRHRHTPAAVPTGTQIACAGQPASRESHRRADGLNLRRRRPANRMRTGRRGRRAIQRIALPGGQGRDTTSDLRPGDRRRDRPFGESSNESRVAPNGRHLAFTSTRAGRVQIFTIGRDGRGLKQITRDGSNFTPSWSN